MSTFASSFWSNDYAAGLGVLFGKLQQGVQENQQILTVARLRADAEEAYGNTLSSITPATERITGGFSKDEGVEFAMRKHGDSVRVTSNFYIFYGRVEAIMQAAPGRGVISSVNLLSDDLDEIDWEVMGQNNTNVFNNWYGKGNRTQNHGEEPLLADSQTGFHNYTIIWTEQELQFWLDGNQVRTVASDEPGRYPQTPCYINLSLWAGGDPDNEPGVIEWAGGETDYKAG